MTNTATKGVRQGHGHLQDLASPPRVESDNEEMSGTKIGNPKFTGKETDVRDKGRDWFIGLQTYFTKKAIGNGEWERSCGLIRWSLVSDSIR